MSSDAEQNYPNESMWNDNGIMRMMPGWTQILRRNEVLQEDMPYAHKRTELSFGNEDKDLLWGEKSGEFEEIVLTLDELPAPSDPEPLPLLTKKSLRQITRGNGEYEFKVNFKPYAVYKLDTDNSPKNNQEARGDKREYLLDIYYPLFKAEKVEQIQKRKMERPAQPRTSKSKTKRNEWHSGDWSLNDEQAGMYEAQNPGVHLIKCEDGRWCHPDYWEREYTTSLGNVHTDSSIAENDRLGFFDFEGNKYVWKLSSHCQDIQLYEAHMDRKIRRYMCKREEEKAREWKG